jgi:hypothetical protein
VLYGASAKVIPGVSADARPEFGFGPAGVRLLGPRDQLAFVPAFRGGTGGPGFGNPDLYRAQTSGAHFVAASSGSRGAGSLVHRLHVARVTRANKTSREPGRGLRRTRFLATLDQLA